MSKVQYYGILLAIYVCTGISSPYLWMKLIFFLLAVLCLIAQFIHVYEDTR